MMFEHVLEESYKRAILHYKGTRDSYKINDPHPYVMILDQKYNADGKGSSILALNLNYHDGNIEDLINQINAFDNSSGFKGFEGKLSVKKFLKQKNIEEYETGKRKKRYNELVTQFPFLKRYLRRYKHSGPKGTGIQSKKRKLKK